MRRNCTTKCIRAVTSDRRRQSAFTLCGEDFVFTQSAHGPLNSGGGGRRIPGYSQHMQSARGRNFEKHAENFFLNLLLRRHNLSDCIGLPAIRCKTEIKDLEHSISESILQKSNFRNRRESFCCLLLSLLKFQTKLSARSPLASSLD